MCFGSLLIRERKQALSIAEGKKLANSNQKGEHLGNEKDGAKL